MFIEFVLLLLAVGLFVLLSPWGPGGRSARRRARKKMAKDSRPYRETTGDFGAAGNLDQSSRAHRVAAVKVDIKALAQPLGQLADIQFEKRKLMNAAEAQLFSSVDNIIGALGAGHRLMARTSLGEVIQAKHRATAQDGAALASIYSSVLDLVVVDQSGMVVLAVEVQPCGATQDTILLRDAVKREALRRAGIPMLEVEKGMNPSELRSQVMRHLAEPALAEGGAQ